MNVVARLDERFEQDPGASPFGRLERGEIVAGGRRLRVQSHQHIDIGGICLLHAADIGSAQPGVADSRAERLGDRHRGLERRARSWRLPLSRSTIAMFRSVSASPWGSARLAPDLERLTQGLERLRRLSELVPRDPGVVER